MLGLFVVGDEVDCLVVVYFVFVDLIEWDVVGWWIDGVCGRCGFWLGLGFVVVGEC